MKADGHHFRFAVNFDCAEKLKAVFG